MVCKFGRPKLSSDQDRQLFAESAGTCLLCTTSLFPEAPSRKRSIPVAERAHIVAHSDDGPRADPALTDAERSHPENLVLLCPTCHTKVDKAPDAYPTALLRRLKQNRREAVARIGGTPVFPDRAAARAAAKQVLERNVLLFEQYGPDPEHGGTKSTEAAGVWAERVVSEIVPNNRVLIALVEVNSSLATSDDRVAAELLRQHTDDRERKHLGEDGITGPAARFPKAASQLFGGPET